MAVGSLWCVVLAAVSLICAYTVIYGPGIHTYPLTWIWNASVMTLYHSPNWGLAGRGDRAGGIGQGYAGFGLAISDTGTEKSTEEE